MAKTTPKDFFMWAGAMVALYWSVVSFLGLIFDYINYAFPSPTNYYPVDPYQSGISYEMASLIVLFPLCVLLMRLIHRDIVKDSSRSEIWVRRWAIFLTLFAAGATMAGDLIWLLTSFLNGSDLTAPFLLKAALVFLVAAAVFLHFMADFWGYWEKYPSRGHSVGYATSLLVVLSIASGFFIVGTPAQARHARLDAEKVSALQSIQQEVVTYWQSKKALPKTLTDLNDSISGFTAPLDPETNTQYGYTVTGPLSFQLCATFTTASSASGAMNVPQPYGVKGLPDNWSHAKGIVCFDRTIDKDRYLPTKSQ